MDTLRQNHMGNQVVSIIVALVSQGVDSALQLCVQHLLIPFSVFCFQTNDRHSDKVIKARRNAFVTLSSVVVCFFLCWIWNQVQFDLKHPCTFVKLSSRFKFLDWKKLQAYTSSKAKFRKSRSLFHKIYFDRFMPDSSPVHVTCICFNLRPKSSLTALIWYSFWWFSAEVNLASSVHNNSVFLLSFVSVCKTAKRVTSLRLHTSARKTKKQKNRWKKTDHAHKCVWYPRPQISLCIHLFMKTGFEAVQLYSCSSMRSLLFGGDESGNAPHQWRCSVFAPNVKTYIPVLHTCNDPRQIKGDGCFVWVFQIFICLEK